MNKKKKIIGIVVWAVCFVALLLVATFYDLQINVALGNADSVFGQFFRLFGELTGWIIIPVATAILFKATDEKKKWGKVLHYVLLIGIFVGWYLSVDYILGELTGADYEGLYQSPYRLMKLYTVIFALGLTGLSVLAVKNMNRELIKKLVVFAVALLIALAISQIVANVAKSVWTRQRFRNLDIGNGGTSEEGFTPWYIINFGKNKGVNYVPDSVGMPESDAYKSFPSGHTTAAALTFVLVMLPDIFEKLKKYRVWFYIVPTVYTVAVAVSRIVNRAHYLSDTLFGATIGALSSFAAIAIAKKIKQVCEKKFASKVPDSIDKEGEKVEG